MACGVPRVTTRLRGFIGLRSPVGARQTLMGKVGVGFRV